MNQNEVYANFFVRLLAKLTDWVILFIPQAIFCYFISQRVLSLANLITGIILYLSIFSFTGFIISLLYNSLTTSLWGGTIGKIIAGLNVVDEKGNKLSFTHSMFRHSVGYAVSAILLWMGYFWIIKDKNKQGWHDHVSETYVIQKHRKHPVLIIAVFIILLALNLSLSYQSLSNLTSNTTLRSDIKKVEKLIKESFREPSPYKSPKDGSQIS